MAGGEARYDAVNHFFSDVFDLTLLGWGEARAVDRRLIRGSTSGEKGDFVEIGIGSRRRWSSFTSGNSLTTVSRCSTASR